MRRSQGPYVSLKPDVVHYKQKMDTSVIRGLERTAHIFKMRSFGKL